MSRWVLTLAAIGLALTPTRAADPLPVWEFDSPGDAKTLRSVRWVGFSPDGRQLAAQIDERTKGAFESRSRLRVWNLATRTATLNHKSDEGEPRYGNTATNAVTKAGSVLLAGGNPAEVRLSDGTSVVAKGFWRDVIGVWSHADDLTCLWLAGNDFVGYELARGRMPPLAADPKKPLPVAEWMKSKLPGQWGGGDPPPTAAVNADLTRLAVSSRNRRDLTLYNLTTTDTLALTETAAVKPTHAGPIEIMRFSPDGKTLATADGSASLFLWDVAKADKDWTPRATIPIGNFPACALAFSPDGKTLAAGTLDKKGRPNLFLIDVAVGKPLTSYALPGQLTAVAYSADGKTLVTGNNLGLVQAWDAEKLRNP